MSQVIPNLTIFVLSCAMILKARKMRKELNDILQKEKSKEDFKIQMNLIWTMLIVYLAFLFTTLPLTVLFIIYPIGHANEKVCAMVLSWSSGVINPFIYSLRNKQIKDAYISLCRSMICLPPKSTEQISTLVNTNTTNISNSTNDTEV